MKSVMNNNIKIYNELKTDKDNYIQVLVFYIRNALYDEFRNHPNYSKILDINYNISILDHPEKDDDLRGYYYSNENNITITINCYNIKRWIKIVECRKSYTKYLTSRILQTFLHEFKHLLITIEEYLNDNTNEKKLEYFFDEKNKIIGDFYKTISPDVLDNISHKSRLVDDELICDFYAYKNLNIINNMMNDVKSNNLLI